jgi:hypothetical protein
VKIANALEAQPNTDELSRLALNEVEERWNTMAQRIEELDALVSYNQAKAECRAESLEAVIQIADFWEQAQTHLIDVFDQAYLSRLLELVFREAAGARIIPRRNS